MRCGDVHEYLFAFLDNELDAPLSIEVQRHLDRCPHCAREVEIERAVHKEMVRAFDGGYVEPPFDAAVVTACVTENPETAQSDIALQAPVHTPARASSPTVVSRRRRWWPPIGLAASLGIAAILYQPWAPSPAPRYDRFAMLVAADFEHFLEEGQPLQVVSGSATEVAEWLSEQTGVSAVLPVLGEQEGRLIGGRRCKIGGAPAAFAIYEIGGTSASLVVMDAEGVTFEGMEQFTEQGRRFWGERCDAHTIVACRRGDQVYAAASDLPRELLLRLVVD